MPDNKMQLVHTSGSIDLRTWEFFATDDPTGGLRDALMIGFVAQVTTVLHDQFEETPPELELPFAWSTDDGRNGKRPTDPLMLYVALPIGADLDNPVCYACSLEAAIDDLIDLHVECGTHKVNDPIGKAICAQTAARLRELADKLESACDQTASPDGAGRAIR